MTVHVPPPSPDGVSAILRVRTIDTLAGILALQEDWTALERVAEGGVLFQSHAWCLTAARHLDARGEGGMRVLVVEETGPLGDVLVALLPMRLWRRGVRTVLTGLAEPFQQYTEMLLAPGRDAGAVWRALLPVVKGLRADYCHLGQVRSGGPLHKGLGGTADAMGDPAGAPVVDFAAFDDFDTYFQTITTKTRKNLRNARNKLGREGELAHVVSETGADLRTVIARTYEGRGAWLERMGLTSRAFNDTGFSDFLDRLKAPEETGLTTLGFSLMLGDAPMAEQWGFVHNGRYYAFVSTWDAAHEAMSPGRLHLGDVVRACHERGLETVDFIVPAVPYKLTWATRTDAVQDYVIPLSPLGHLYATGWLKYARPAAKRAMLALDPAKRRWIARILRRH